MIVGGVARLRRRTLATRAHGKSKERSTTPTAGDVLRCSFALLSALLDTDDHCRSCLVAAGALLVAVGGRDLAGGWFAILGSDVARSALTPN